MIFRCDLVPQYEAYKTEILAAIERTLNSGRYIMASETEIFEKEFAKYIGTSKMISVGNATDGLILSIKALGIKPGDEIITTPFTAIPTISAIIASGATPVFADIENDTYLVDINKVAEKITSKTKAIMPVHIFGNVVDICKLQHIAPEIPIIEDAAQAHGSTISGKKAGSMGVLGVFSFYPTKNLGAYGDGGCIATNDLSLDKKLRLLKMYGMEDKDHIVINGVNSRLDEIQAAILSVKLKYLDEMNLKRVHIVERYRNELNPKRFICQKIPDGVVSNYHVLCVRFNGDRGRFMQYMSDNGIQTNVYYEIPLHLQEATRYLNYKQGDFPIAEGLCSEVVALPLYPELPNNILDQIIDTINNYQGK
jgi:dTDP-4-amino-4,6-dideoxygalactose transaminase